MFFVPRMQPSASAALTFVVLTIGLSEANPDAKRLYDDLLSNYNKLIRPVNNHSEKVTVKLGMRLSQLVDLNLKDQVLTTNVWLEHEWNDYKFAWDPAEYGGVTELYVPSETIWRPDIILYNNADGDFIVRTMTKAILHFDSRVVWTPPAIFKSSCEIDVEFFPFDEQTCFLKFGSWSHDGFQVDIVHINAVPGNDTVMYGIDLSEYYLNVEWDILDVQAQRHVKSYACCPEPYPDIYFNITIRRKPLFYIVNLIIPCLGIFYLSILVFYLPAQSGEKISLVTNVLISHVFYFTLVIEVIPATSKTVPLLGRYLMLSMILIAVGFILTTIVINLQFRKPSTHTMPNWVIKDSMKSRRSKFLRHSDPALKSLAGEDDDEEVTAAEDSSSSEKVQSQLKGHLNGLYSGFATIIKSTAQIDSKDDVNRAPFVIEKAIHNIIFIKHHMKRQDEFDAEDQDWGIVAMVLDRLFLWVFCIAGGLGSIFILTRSPYMYDNPTPIDILYSEIGQTDSTTFDD